MITHGFFLGPSCSAFSRWRRPVIAGRESSLPGIVTITVRQSLIETWTRAGMIIRRISLEPVAIVITVYIPVP